MATKQISDYKRKNIDFFEGVNSQVSDHLAKKEELRYATNARSKIIGVIEKRDGIRRLGTATPTAIANYGLFNFPNSTGTSMFRVSTVSGPTTAIYYLSSSSVWTVLTGNGTSLTAAQMDTTNAESCCFLVNGTDVNKYIKANGTSVHTSTDLGAGNTQFDITNPTGTTMRYSYDSTGTDPLINTNIFAGDTIHIMSSTFNAANNGSFVVTASGSDTFDVTNASGVAEANKTIGTGALRVSNHLTNSPIASRVKYYKDRICLGNYKIGSTEYKTGIAFSSVPLGIVTTIKEDASAGVTSIDVTDTKYIYSDDVLDVYRGDTLIETLIITAKTESNLTVATTSSAMEAGDNLWVAGTYTGARVFRWPGNIETGENVKQYDTFKITGDPDNAITMMEDIGNVLMIANNNSLATWNGSAAPTEYNLGIGCASKNGYVKHLGILFFCHYGGIYMTAGELPQLISSKVEEYFEGATKAGIEASTMGRKGKSIFCAIGDVTLYNPDGSTKRSLTDVVLEYDLRKEQWYVHTGINASQFATYNSTADSDRLEFIETSGHVQEFLVKPSLNADRLDDNDSEIPFMIGTSNVYLSKEFENICYPKYLVVEVLAGNSIGVFVSLDDKSEYQLKETISKGINTIMITPRSEDEREARCNKLAIYFKESSTRRVKIGRVAVLIKETKETE